jgi:hypothetical protein
MAGTEREMVVLSANLLVLPNRHLDELLAADLAGGIALATLAEKLGAWPTNTNGATWLMSVGTPRTGSVHAVSPVDARYGPGEPAQRNRLGYAKSDFAAKRGIEPSPTAVAPVEAAAAA